MSPSELRIKLSNNFPSDATCWSDATDEVRDMARAARLALRLNADRVIDFTMLRTFAVELNWHRRNYLVL
jgi:hypothetical protein